MAMAMSIQWLGKDKKKKQYLPSLGPDFNNWRGVRGGCHTPHRNIIYGVFIDLGLLIIYRTYRGGQRARYPRARLA